MAITSQYEYLKGLAEGSRFYDTEKWRELYEKGTDTPYLQALAATTQTTPKHGWDEAMYQSLSRDPNVQFEYLLNQYFEDDDEEYSRWNEAFKSAAYEMSIDNLYDMKSKAEKGWNTFLGGGLEFVSTIGGWFADAFLGLMNMVDFLGQTNYTEGISLPSDTPRVTSDDMKEWSKDSKSQEIREWLDDFNRRNNELGARYAGLTKSGEVALDARNIHARRFANIMNALGPIVTTSVIPGGKFVYSAGMIGNINQGVISDPRWESLTPGMKAVFWGERFITEYGVELLFKGGSAGFGLIPSIGGKLASKLGANGAPKVIQLIVAALGSGIEEATEEVVTEILQAGFDGLIFDGTWNAPNSEELWMAAVVGALAGSLATAGQVFTQKGMSFETANGTFTLGKLDSFLYDVAADNDIMTKLARETEVTRQTVLRNITTEEFETKFPEEYKAAVAKDEKTAKSLVYQLQVIETLTRELGLAEKLPNIFGQVAKTFSERATNIRNFVEYNWAEASEFEKKHSTKTHAIQVVAPSAEQSNFVKSIGVLTGKPAFLVRSLGKNKSDEIHGVKIVDDGVLINEAYLKDNTSKQILDELVIQEISAERIDKVLSNVKPKEWKAWGKTFKTISEMGLKPYERNSVKLDAKTKAQAIMYTSFGIKAIVQTNKEVAIQTVKTLAKDLKKLRKTTDMTKEHYNQLRQTLFTSLRQYHKEITEYLTENNIEVSAEDSIFDVNSYVEQVDRLTRQMGTIRYDKTVWQMFNEKIQEFINKDEYIADNSKSILDRARYTTEFLNTFAPNNMSIEDMLADRFCDVEWNDDLGKFAPRIYLDWRDGTELISVALRPNTAMEQYVDSNTRLRMNLAQTTGEAGMQLPVSDFVSSSTLRAVYGRKQNSIFADDYVYLSKTTIKLQYTKHGRTRGTYNVKDNTITVYFNENSTVEEVRSRVYHEIRHAIQNIYGRQSGSNPAAIRNALIQSVIDANSTRTKMLLFLRNIVEDIDELTTQGYAYTYSRSEMVSRLGFIAGKIGETLNIPWLQDKKISLRTRLDYIIEHELLDEVEDLPTTIAMMLVKKQQQEIEYEEAKKRGETPPPVDSHPTTSQYGSVLDMASRLMYELTYGEIEARARTYKEISERFAYFTMEKSGLWGYETVLTPNDTVKLLGWDIELELKGENMPADDMTNEIESWHSLLSQEPGLINDIKEVWQKYYGMDEPFTAEKLYYVFGDHVFTQALYLNRADAFKRLYDKIKKTRPDDRALFESVLSNTDFFLAESPETISKKTGIPVKDILHLDNAFRFDGGAKLMALNYEVPFIDALILSMWNYIHKSNPDMTKWGPETFNIREQYSLNFQEEVKRFLLDDTITNPYGITSRDYIESDWNHTMKSYLVKRFGVSFEHGTLTKWVELINTGTFNNEFIDRVKKEKLVTVEANHVFKLGKDADPRVREQYNRADTLVVFTYGMTGKHFDFGGKLFDITNDASSNIYLNENNQPAYLILVPLDGYKTNHDNSLIYMQSVLIHEMQHMVGSMLRPTDRISLPSNALADVFTTFPELAPLVYDALDAQLREVGVIGEVLTYIDPKKPDSIIKVLSTYAYMLNSEEAFARSAKGQRPREHRLDITGSKVFADKREIKITPHGAWANPELAPILRYLEEKIRVKTTTTGTTTDNYSQRSRKDIKNDVAYQIQDQLKFKTKQEMLDYGFSVEFTESYFNGKMMNGDVKEFINYDKVGNVDAWTFVADVMFPNNFVLTASSDSIKTNLDLARILLPVLACLDTTRDNHVYTKEEAFLIQSEFSNSKVAQYTEYSYVVDGSHPNVWLLNRNEPIFTVKTAKELLKAAKLGLYADVDTAAISNTRTTTEGDTVQISDVVEAGRVQSAEEEYLSTTEDVNEIDNMASKSLSAKDFLAVVQTKADSASQKERAKMWNAIQTRKGTSHIREIYGDDVRKKTLKILESGKRPPQYYADAINREKRRALAEGIDLGYITKEHPHHIDTPLDELENILKMYKDAYAEKSTAEQERKAKLIEEIEKRAYAEEKSKLPKPEQMARRDRINEVLDESGGKGDNKKVGKISASITRDFKFASRAHMTRTGFHPAMASHFFDGTLTDAKLYELINKKQIGDDKAWDYVIATMFPNNLYIKTYADLQFVAKVIPMLATVQSTNKKVVTSPVETLDAVNAMTADSNPAEVELYNKFVAKLNNYYTTLLSENGKRLLTIEFARDILIEAHAGLQTAVETEQAQVAPNISEAQEAMNIKRGKVTLTDIATLDTLFPLQTAQQQKKKRPPISVPAAGVYFNVMTFERNQKNPAGVESQFKHTFSHVIRDMSDDNITDILANMSHDVDKMSGVHPRNAILFLIGIQNFAMNASSENTKLAQKMKDKLGSSAGRNLAATATTFEREVFTLSLRREADRLGVDVNEDLLETHERLRKAGKWGDLKKVERAILVDMALRLSNENRKKFTKGSWKDKREVLFETISKLNSFRYMSMLSNPATHVRNIVSNVALRGINSIVENMAGFIEKKFVIPLFGESEFSMGSRRMKIADNVDEFVDDALVHNGRLEYMMGATKYKSGSGEATLEQKIKTTVPFRTEALNKIHDLIFDSLDWGDKVFVGPEIIRRLKQYIQANIINKGKKLEDMSEKTFEYYLHVATSEATTLYLRNKNKLSEWYSRTASKNPFIEMLLGAVMPFPKVLANMTMFIYRYSPLGLFTVIRDVLKQKTDSRIETYQTEETFINDYGRAEKRLVTKERTVGSIDPWFSANVSRNTAQAMLGTFAMLLGLGLGAAGVLDYEEKDYGMVLRLGQFSITLDAIAPAFSPLLIGASLLAKSGDNATAFYYFLETMRNLSVYGAVDALFTFNNDAGDVISSALGSYFLQYIPAILKTANKIIDPGKKETKGDILLRIASSLPGLSFLVADKIDPYTGEVIDYDLAHRFGAFTSLIVPFKWRWTDLPMLEMEAQRIGAETQGYTGRMLINGEQTKLTNREKETYARVRGELVFKMGNDVMNSREYKNADDEERRKMLTSVYDKATEYTKIKYWVDQGHEYITPNFGEFSRIIEYVTSNDIRYKKDYKGLKFKK